MSRYIDADKVMEEIARMGGHGLCEWSTLGVKALINRQPTADVEPRVEWISVEERLPERELQELMRMNPLKVFPCLVVITSDYYNKAYVSQAYYAEEGFISGDSGLITERITHWMPLPEPPKGDHHE